MPGLTELAAVVCRIGITTFGSGTTTVILLSREMTERKWLLQRQCDSFYALARVVPGTNVLAFVASSAHAVRGWVGAAAAVVALSVPASFVVVALTLAYERWHNHPAGGAVIGAAMASIAGIILGAAWLLSRPRFVRGDRIRAFLLVAGAAALSQWISPLMVIGAAAVAGYFWPDRSAPAADSPN